jgi:hypothetical protein
MYDLSFWSSGKSLSLGYLAPVEFAWQTAVDQTQRQ